MEKSILVALLLGIALISYGPLTSTFGDGLKNCTCDSIQDMVAWAEGTKNCVYRDSLGIPTIGIGFNLKRSEARSIISNVGANYDSVLAGSQCLTASQITSIFNEDLKWARAGAQSCVPSFGSQKQCVQNVLIDMTFNMGKVALCGWPNFVAQLGRKEMSAAASNMQSTKWCGQVGRRCARNTQIVRDC